MTALLALIPTRDWLYGGLAVALGLIAWDLHHKYEAAIKYQQTVQAESKQAAAAAAKTIADNTASYNAALAAEKVSHANDLAAASQQHDADVARLRNAAPARAGRPVLDSSAAPAPESYTGPGGPPSVGGLSEQAGVCQGLADALRADDATLTTERAERDALTGK